LFQKYSKEEAAFKAFKSSLLDLGRLPKKTFDPELQIQLKNFSDSDTVFQ